jgi:hypothetical protein
MPVGHLLDHVAENGHRRHDFQLVGRSGARGRWAGEQTAHDERS